MVARGTVFLLLLGKAHVQERMLVEGAKNPFPDRRRKHGEEPRLDDR